jgi:hypothetical protein
MRLKYVASSGARAPGSMRAATPAPARPSRSGGRAGRSSGRAHAAELPHRVAHRRLDERVHHDCRASAGLLHGDVEVVDVLDARMPDLLERLIGELRLEREHETLRRLPVESETM